MSLSVYLEQSRDVLTACLASPGVGRAGQATEAIIAALEAGKPLLVCGNGGSASDAMHIAGELVGRYLKERRAINCIALSANPAVLTAWANDYDYDSVFARQVEAHGATGGVLWGISTSGNSKNVIAAFETARRMGMITIALTGEGGGTLAALSDILIDVPAKATPLIQQAHLCVYHWMCETIEARLAG